MTTKDMVELELKVSDRETPLPGQNAAGGHAVKAGIVAALGTAGLGVLLACVVSMTVKKTLDRAA